MYLIDGYSRKVWVYILKIKDQALEKLKVWKALVENQSGFKLKYLRTIIAWIFVARSLKNFVKNME